MAKSFVVLLSILLSLTLCAEKTEALLARDEALSALRGFNPATMLPGFTENPKESKLKPQEGENTLPSQGLDALKTNPDAKAIYQEAQERRKTPIDLNSQAMKRADDLLDKTDAVLKGECFEEKFCQTQTINKTCEEQLRYSNASCKDELSVALKPFVRTFHRILKPNLFLQASFHLTRCALYDWQCTLNTITLIQPCEALAVKVSQFPFDSQLPILKQPSCQDPIVTVQLRGGRGDRGGRSDVLVQLTEYISEEQWFSDCGQINQTQCQLQSSNNCLSPNTTQVINGVPIRRPCWGRAYDYQCKALAASNCTAFINQGCLQLASLCQSNQTPCEYFQQTFQCEETQCTEPRIICPGKGQCVDGNCDESKIEESDDIQEGLSRLAVLAEAASDVASQQFQSKTPTIFAGKPQQCKKYPLGFRDCCTDSGWGDWIKHCPEALQALQKAKEEKRVVFLGHYENSKLGARHYSYCVFPTKLAAIVQMEGRGNQLGINYGTVEEPDCRGLTPEELEHINFALLDLSPIETEIVARMTLPNAGLMKERLKTKVTHLNQRGKAHD